MRGGWGDICKEQAEDAVRVWRMGMAINGLFVVGVLSSNLSELCILSKTVKRVRIKRSIEKVGTVEINDMIGAFRNVKVGTTFKI